MKKTAPAVDQAPPRRLIPVTDWDKYHPWPSEAGLRHLIFEINNGNGFEKALRRVGTRCLIDERAFFEFVDQQGGRHE
jgi:hypothetical protein